VLCTIRKVFSTGAARDRETALRDVAKAMGHQRLGAKARKVLETDLLTAVRRGILENERGQLSLLARHMSDYERSFLKEMFLAAIGRRWVEREEAIRLLARHMGFARTGSEMMKLGRSLINGLIRTKELESEGKEMIRRG